MSTVAQTVSEAINELSDEKAIYLGTVNCAGTGMKGMFNAIPSKYYNKTVIGTFNSSGLGFFIALRYGSTGQYGHIMAMKYNDITIYHATVVENSFAFQKLSQTSQTANPFT